jgi:polyisoprenoid-binding protein YceI
MGPLPRRALAAAAALAVLAGGGWLFLATRDAPPSARLRQAAGPGGSGQPDGDWVVASDADGFVGYRVRERLGSISAPNDVVGRSPAVSGAATIAGGVLTAAEVTVDMTRLRTDVEPRDGRMREEGLETLRFPTASFHLDRPVPLGDVSGARVVELRLPGTLTLHGVAKPLEFPVQARWDGPSIQVAGSARIRRADFGLEVPTLVGYRIEDTGVVELELTLVRRGATLAAPVSTLRRTTAIPRARAGPDEDPGRPQGPPCRGGGRPPGGGGRLLFTAITSADEEHLFTLGADGRGLRRVGRDDANELDPTWSPDGRRIAYARAEPYQFSSPPSVHVIRADGSGRKRLTPRQLSIQPDWSPDGRRLAVTVAGAMEVTRIAIVGADGAAVRELDGTPTADSEPRWSPDGRRLAVSAYGGPGNDDVALLDPATGRFQRLTTSPSYEHSPAWSPDGRRIAYVKDGAIHVMRADGAGDRRLTRGREDAAPAWSPDGARLSFVRDGNLHVIRATGSGSTCLRVGMLLTSGARWQPAP